MSKITLRVDEELLAIVRCYAARRNTTVNALVREFLKTIAAHEARGSQARVRLRELSEQTPGRLGQRAWSRDELHNR